MGVMCTGLKYVFRLLSSYILNCWTHRNFTTLGYAEELISKVIKAQGIINRTTLSSKIFLAHDLQGSSEFSFAFLFHKHEVERFLEAKIQCSWSRYSSRKGKGSDQSWRY